MRQQTKSDSTDSLSEQIAVATRLHEEDVRQLQAVQERLAATKAAEEMGIPATYMDRAAAELAARQMAKAKRRKRRLAGGVLGAVAAIAAFGTWGVTHRDMTPPPPLVYDFTAPSQPQWHFDNMYDTYNGNPVSQPSLSFPAEQGYPVALIKVFRFSQPWGDYIDLATNQIPRPLTGYKTVSFRVRGKGLGQIRLFLQGSHERWCSPFLTASGEWHTVRLPLSQFLHQKIPAISNIPEDAPYVAPTVIGKISFLVGREANPPDEHGEIAIDNLRFE